MSYFAALASDSAMIPNMVKATDFIEHPQQYYFKEC